MPNRNLFTLLALLVVLAALWPMTAYLRYANQPHPATPAAFTPPTVAPDPKDPPEVAIGERLFREPRFAQFFAAHSNGAMNAALAEGDPALSRTMTATGTPLPGAFEGSSMSCRACHMVDEHAAARTGSRSYTDFGRQSPIPDRGDGLLVTTRNSPTSVEVTVARDNLLLHDDGEFATAEDLVRETILGRNFGWLPTERAQALRNAARVIREDDGSGALARAFGGPYRAVFAGALSVPEKLRLPPAYRLDVTRATDVEILDATARLVAAYLRSLAFHRGGDRQLDGSPYDRFLLKNGLPRGPEHGEPDSVYARRLRDRLERLADPKFVNANEGSFRLHDQDFVFGPEELRGLMIFLAEPGHAAAGAPRGVGVGNCASCHAPPRFTDFGFHNTGESEAQYEAIHGAGSFRRLTIPDLEARNADYDTWLPPTAAHPHATGRLRSPPSRMRPGYADLGLWNVLANPDLPKPQGAIRALLGRERTAGGPSAALTLAVGCFKTPSLRDLGHSAPYLHSGRADSLEQVIAHYVEFSARARAGTMRNTDARLRGMVLGTNDVRPLVAFLKSLNEDYE
jgi:cytochrome c peroxidase